MALLVVLLIMVGVVAAAWYVVEWGRPQVVLGNDLARLGRSRELSLALNDGGRGLRSVEVVLVQGGKAAKVFERTYDRQGFLGLSGPAGIEEKIKVSPAELKFTDGAAQLLVKVRDYSWWGWRRGNLTELTIPTVIDTKPPQVTILNSGRYIAPGGSGAVVYQFDEEVGENGVLCNGNFHPGFSLPKKGDKVHGAVFALPFDATRLEQLLVRAVDLAGNEVKMPFPMYLKDVAYKSDKIEVSESFLDTKLPEFGSHYPELGGKPPVEQYLEVNGRIRRENNAKIREVCAKSRPEQLWSGTFAAMARGSRKAGYAETRTYRYQGRDIDRQIHLGIDLASTAQAPVKSASRGVVAFADYLGIYGNMVIVDHGCGVFTLYSHLSQIQAKVGDEVTPETTLGLTGTTGMAGGDHLHFSVLVNGIFVNPLEWWDSSWMGFNINGIL
ncbi:MAG TPA: M23 family metallopeptidase [Desulfurivibrionaceae bacterium]|nr:M23 family metallopeptidase [Desulfurivibrionaceae bacterium]